jgi:hypothetical protein
MRKKYISIIISIVLVALIITLGQIFTIKNVEVEFNNQTDITSTGEILEIIGIDTNTNIFSLKESEITQTVSQYYNNAIDIDIERTFPNTVIIHVEERLPIYLMTSSNSVYTGSITTDKDFQRSDIYNEEDDLTLITVNNYTVQSSFNTEECIRLREFSNTLINLGMEDSSIVVLIESITIEEETLTINLRNNNAVWVVEKDNIITQTEQFYNSYILLSPLEREDLVLS